MSDDKAPSAVEDAAAVLTPEALGDDPSVTPTIAGGETVPGESAEVDAAGVTYDPAIHERDRRTDGQWKRKRGQGSRKAAGKPVVVPAKDGGSVVVIPGREDRPAAASSAASPAAEEGLPAEIVGDLTPEDCRPTAVSVVSILWFLARIVMGPDWKPTPEERKTWEDEVARAWAASGFPRLGGWGAVAVLGVDATRTRMDMPETQSRWKRFLVWCGLKKHDPPKVADG